MESFSAKSKRNGSEGSLSELLGEGTSTRLGPRKRAFQEFDAEVVKAIEEELNEDVVEALEVLRGRVAALENGAPKVGKKDKNGVVKVIHLVCISKSGNRIYFRDMGPDTLDVLKESFTGCYGFKAKKDALAYIDNASMLDNSIKMF
jgi:hypothetical protein